MRSSFFSMRNFPGAFKSRNRVPLFRIFLIDDRAHQRIMFAYPILFLMALISIIRKEAQRSRLRKSYLTNAGTLLRQRLEIASLYAVQTDLIVGTWSFLRIIHGLVHLVFHLHIITPAQTFSAIFLPLRTVHSTDKSFELLLAGQLPDACVCVFQMETV